MNGSVTISARSPDFQRAFVAMRYFWGMRGPALADAQSRQDGALSLAFPARCCDKVLGKHRIMLGHNDAPCCQRFLELPQIEIDALPFLVNIGDSLRTLVTWLICQTSRH